MTDPTHALDPQLLAAIPAEVLEHDCGCGSAWRWAREGETVLDLGCGSGKTCFLLSRIVGRSGRVIGVDASAAMITVARRHQDEVARVVGWRNVQFVQARFEELGSLGSSGGPVDDGSVDVVIMDCVLTFVQARERGVILDEAMRVLRAEGRMLVSDVLREDLEGIPEALVGAGFERIEVVQQSDEVRRVIDGVPRFATTLLAGRGRARSPRK